MVSAERQRLGEADTRGAPLPTGGWIDQADGTAGMALYCQAAYPRQQRVSASGETPAA